MSNNKASEKPSEPAETRKRTITEKMAVAEKLRDLQSALKPLREANRKRAAGKVEIRIKTK